jgi:alpha-amylase/alpha-mannosidase (GH57 family)
MKGRPLELYAVFDKPVYEPGESARLHLLAHFSEARSIGLEVASREGVLLEAAISGGPGEVVVKPIELEVPEVPGVYELAVKTGGSVASVVKYVVAGEIKDRYLAFVWHHHQAPNYLPDGTYYFLWAFVHTWSDELAPYGKGPYHYHAVVLEKNPGYKCTYNLSPSLLVQWVDATERGVKHRGGYVPPDSAEVGLVREALEIYKRAARRGQIDVLTSMYAHSIAGYLIEYLGAEDIVAEEFEYGLEVTRRVIGVEPKGAWTPEMAFHMKLVDIYSKLGLEYTVLDAKCHLQKSAGREATHLEPYLVKGAEGAITVFFRDTELSNYLGFKNNYESPLHAWKAAYDFAAEASARLLGGGILTIALDGENWMIFSKRPPLTAVFYEKLVGYLLRLQESGYLKTATLRELARSVQPRVELKSLPTTSWLCGFSKWHGQVADHEAYWKKARAAYELVKSYEQRHGRDERSKKARWALWHALDSDYWWAEFWEPRLIDAWLREVEESLKH